MIVQDVLARRTRRRSDACRTRRRVKVVELMVRPVEGKKEFRDLEATRRVQPAEPASSSAKKIKHYYQKFNTLVTERGGGGCSDGRRYAFHSFRRAPATVVTPVGRDLSSTPHTELRAADAVYCPGRHVTGSRTRHWYEGASPLFRSADTRPPYRVLVLFLFYFFFSLMVVVIVRRRLPSPRPCLSGGGGGRLAARVRVCAPRRRSP